MLDDFIKAASDAVSIARAPGVNDSSSTRARAPRYTAPNPAKAMTMPSAQQSIEPPPA